MNPYQLESDRINDAHQVNKSMNRQQVIQVERERQAKMRALNEQRGLPYRGGFIE